MKIINTNFGKNLLTKLLLIIIIIAFALWGIGDFFTSTKKNVIAEVNGEPIYTKEYLNRLNKNKNFINSLLLRGKTEEEISYITLNILISEKIIDLIAEEEHIYINDKTLSNFIKKDEKFKLKGKFSRTEYEKFLLKNQLSHSEFENKFKKNLLKKIIIDSSTSGFNLSDYHKKTIKEDIFKEVSINFFQIKNDFNISNKEIETYFKKNKLEFSLGELRDGLKIKLSKKNLNIEKNDDTSFFEIISNIENDILDNISIDRLSKKYNLTIEKIEKINRKGINIDYNKSRDEFLVDTLFVLNDDIKIQLYEKDNDFYIVELGQVYQNEKITLNENITKDIKKKILVKKKREMSNIILNKINDDNNYFDIYASQNSIKIEKTSLSKLNKSELFKKNIQFNIIDKKKKYYFVEQDENFYIIKYLSSRILNDKANKYEKTIETEVKKRFKNLVLNEFDLIFNKKYKININREIYNRINKNTFQ